MLFVDRREPRVDNDSHQLTMTLVKTTGCRRKHVIDLDNYRLVCRAEKRDGFLLPSDLFGVQATETLLKLSFCFYLHWFWFIFGTVLFLWDNVSIFLKCFWTKWFPDYLLFLHLKIHKVHVFVVSNKCQWIFHQHYDKIQEKFNPNIFPAGLHLRVKAGNCCICSVWRRILT